MILIRDSSPLMLGENAILLYILILLLFLLVGDQMVICFSKKCSLDFSRTDSVGVCEVREMHK